MTAGAITGDGTLVGGLGGDFGFGELVAPRNDDGTFFIADVTSVFESGINFFGSTYTSFYVNTNGSITFGTGVSQFTPSAITGGGVPMIAAFWADVDTRTPTAIGAESAAISIDIDAATDIITITWPGVNYYLTSGDKQNFFQMQLYDRGGGDFDIVYRYDDINWTTGDASGGISGLGGTPARIGFTAGDGDNFFELAQSGNQAALLALESTTGNTGVTGRWDFEVRDGETLIPTEQIFAQQGKLAFLAELARGAYHYRIDTNFADAINSSEDGAPDGPTDASFDLANQYLKLMDATDFAPSVAATLTMTDNSSVIDTSIDGLENGIFTSDNGAALVARSQDALFIAFRGTNDGEDLLHDNVPGFNAHWALFEDLRTAISNIVNTPTSGIEHVYVTGHSLGGAMVQALMREHAGDARFEAVTFGQPGFATGADQADARITNFSNDGDIVANGLPTTRTDGDQNTLRNTFSLLEDPLNPAFDHAMGLYAAEIAFLRTNGIDVGQTNGSAQYADFDSIVFNAELNGNYEIGLLNDVLYGTNSADMILGGIGTDTLTGYYGNDLLLGGDDNDTLYGVADNDTLDGGAGNDTLDGGVGNDTLIGGIGIDVLDGRSGADTMIGGADADTYYWDNALDQIIELAGGGTDQIRSFVSLDMNASAGLQQVERGYTFGTANITIFGNALNNVMGGNGGNNRLEGRGGLDQIDGAGGDDFIIGGAERDTMTGGAGRDGFRWTAITETGNAAGARDVITDFATSTATGSVTTSDYLDFGLIDADTTSSASTFTFIGTDVAFTAAGQLRARTEGANTIVEGNVNADLGSDFQIQLTGLKALVSADFIL